MTQQLNVFEISQLEAQRANSGERYLEFLRVPAMSAGVYVLPAGGIDPQTPHKENEMYYVVRGRGRIRVGSEERSVSAGSVIFVAARVDHRFFDIVDELVLLVFFAPAESQHHVPATE
jgi:mannose-6-phosphate isomerase-like protein (cupin superfamily)